MGDEQAIHSTAVEISVKAGDSAPVPKRSYSEIITKEPDVLQVHLDKKSAWSVPFVLFLAPGVSESLVAFLLLLVNGVMQVLFSYIIFSNEFLGDDFSQKRDEAITWRRSYAHDYKYMDLTDTSLASKVCDEDGSLIFSNLQAALVEEINQFLGLQVMEFELGTFQPGVLLAVLCIFLWNLCVFKELRTIWQLMRVIIYVPKADVTSFGAEVGRLEAIARSRFVVMSVVCLGRATIAVVLLIAGSVWLARTTSISELMLNAVALESVLHVDEFLFSSFMPTLIQHAVQNLPAAVVPHSRLKSRAETGMLFAVLVASLIHVACGAPGRRHALGQEGALWREPHVCRRLQHRRPADNWAPQQGRRRDGDQSYDARAGGCCSHQPQRLRVCQAHRLPPGSESLRQVDGAKDGGVHQVLPAMLGDVSRPHGCPRAH